MFYTVADINRNKSVQRLTAINRIQNHFNDKHLFIFIFCWWRDNVVNRRLHEIISAASLAWFCTESSSDNDKPLVGFESSSHSQLRLSCFADIDNDIIAIHWWPWTQSAAWWPSTLYSSPAERVWHFAVPVHIHRLADNMALPKPDYTRKSLLWHHHLLWINTWNVSALKPNARTASPWEDSVSPAGLSDTSLDQGPHKWLVEIWHWVLHDSGFDWQATWPNPSSNAVLGHLLLTPQSLYVNVTRLLTFLKSFKNTF